MTEAGLRCAVHCLLEFVGTPALNDCEDAVLRSAELKRQLLQRVDDRLSLVRRALLHKVGDCICGNGGSGCEDLGDE